MWERNRSIASRNRTGSMRTLTVASIITNARRTKRTIETAQLKQCTTRAKPAMFANTHKTWRHHAGPKSLVKNWLGLVLLTEE